MNEQFLNNEITIGNRKIGPSHPPVVIAEIGINHGGSLKEAIKIADAAISAGAEIIKHQTHIISDEMSEEAKKVIPGHTKESIYEIMASCALSEDDEWKLFKHVESKNPNEIFLNPGSTVKITNRSNDLNLGFVELVGAVNQAGKYRLLQGDTIFELLKRSGGLKSNAYLDGMIFGLVIKPYFICILKRIDQESKLNVLKTDKT